MFMRYLSTAVGALLAALLVAVLSVGVAAPSYAATVGKPLPSGGSAYKKYWDYKEAWNAEMSETVRNNANAKIHPSGVKTDRTPATSSTGKVLQGRIMAPGEKIKVISDIMEPKPGAGTGLAKLLGRGAGVLGMGMLGIGGKAEPPTNAVELFRGSGISEACISSGSACTGDELKKQVQINGCSLNNTCGNYSPAAIEAPVGVQPMPSDMWALLTNQTDQGENAQDSRQFDPTVANGCEYTGKVVGFDGASNITVGMDRKMVGVKPEPQFTSQVTYYNNACVDTMRSPLGYSYLGTCMDAKGNTTHPTTGAGYAYMPTDFTPGKTQGMCVSSSSTPHPPMTLMSVTFLQTSDNSGTGINAYSKGMYATWVNPDPLKNTIDDTKITTTWECLDSSGGLYSYSMENKGSASWPTPNCPDGTRLKKFDVKSKSGASTKLLGGATVNDEAMSTYGDCATTGCELEVYVDGKACTTTNSACQTWTETRTKSPSAVTCKWGSHTVNTSNCNVLAEGYKSERGTIYDPNSESMVSVDNEGETTPSISPTPWNPVNVAPAPGVSPITAGNTGTGTGTAPGGSTLPLTGANPSFATCMGASWSWNPVSWVLTPLQCAFVPQVDVKPRLTAIGNAFAAKPPMSWVVTPVGPSGAGCPNWNISLPGMTQNVICGSSFTGAVVGSRGALFGLVSAAMVWPLLRSLWYASIPILRAVPSR